MQKKTIWTLLLGAAMIGVSGTAIAQDGQFLDAELTQEDIDLGIDDASDFGGFDIGGFDGDLMGCNEGDTQSLLAVNDFSSSESLEKARSQTVSVEDDEVLLAIALANNGAADVTFDKVRSVEQSATRTVTASQSAELERDDVFSALALGVTAEGGSLEALACVSDITTAQTATATWTRDVDLDENTVLLAIAMSNAVGDELAFEEVVSFDEAFSAETSTDQTVDVEREDAFLALALGAGGDGGGDGGGTVV